jgi:hypothetical protein
MRRRHSTNSFSDEYAPTDSETDHYSSSETELTDDDADETNVVDKVDESNNIEYAEEVEEIDCPYLLADEVHQPESISNR